MYLDPPFLSGRKRSKRFANYVDTYHVLEALSQYYTYFDNWIDELSPLYKPKETYPQNKLVQPWLEPKSALKELEIILNKFEESIIVISYRNDSHLKTSELRELIEGYYKSYSYFERPHEYEVEKKAKFNDILIITNN